MSFRAAWQLDVCGARNRARLGHGSIFDRGAIIALPSSATGSGRAQYYQTEPHLVI